MKKIGDIDSYLGYWLRFVSNQVSASFQQRLAKHDTTVAEWIALRFLFSHAPCSLSKLADEMGTDKGAVSRLIERLKQRGLLTRVMSTEDRRLSSLNLTEAGQKLVPKLASIADENDAFFFNHLKPKDTTFLMKLLKDLVEHHGLKKLPTD